MAEYRHHIIQPARSTRGRRPHKTSSIQVYEQTPQGNLLRKQFRYAAGDDDALRRAIDRARRYVDSVANHDPLLALHQQ